MTAWPERDAIRVLHGRAQATVRHVRLPLRSRVWRGGVGNWAGAGVGSSIDFQDHRPYFAGDDPRYIDWQAYARSGHYTMKLYREEVRPQIDVAFDVTPSMAHRKGDRSLELFYFAVESALQSGASLRCHAVHGGGASPWLVEAALGHDIPPPAPEGSPVVPALDRVPWRPGALRVWISDLLFPGAPEPLLATMASARGAGLVLAPFCDAESSPDWAGNIELHDCETGARRLQHMSRELLARYGQSYARHFAMWRASARRHGIGVVRVAAEPELVVALQADGIPSGALEVTG